MASVQTAPAAQQPGPSAPSAQQLNIRDALMKYKQMKESGVSEKDPEFQKVHQMLTSLQQQRLYQQQRAAFAQQQQMLSQQQNSASPAANGINGTRLAAPASNNTPAATQAPATTSLGPSAISATAPPSAAPKGAVQRSAPVGSGYFSPEQLNTLKHQISAFKCLTKNNGIPQALQQQLFTAQRKRFSQSADQHLATPARAADDAQPAANEPEASTKDKDAVVQKQHQYTGFKSPHAGLSSQISYSAHKKREMRPMIPSTMPSGVDIEKLRNEREIILYNRMQSRLAELKALPANLSHLDVRNDDLTPEDGLKRKALIEMKMLALYPRQRAMRERIGRQMIQYDNLAMTANRSHYRRMKKQSLREARITEKLEKQQRDARETREKKKHADYLQTVLNHAREVNLAGQNQRQKMLKVGRNMVAQHQMIEKEEQKRIERTAKQRLLALKSNDEEAYLKLLDQAKDTRITHLLKQTDGFLSQLAASVKAQQRKAAQHYGEHAEEFLADESEEDDEEEEQETRKIDYYAVAHRIKEEVYAQPQMLVGGTLKEYQLKGLQWMISLYNNNLNGILADEMGLGKTIQTISLITYLIEKKKQSGPFLVIVPLSTLTNWNLEFEKWAPSISRVVYKGPPQVRKQQQQQLRYGNFQVLLTTYEYIIKDRPVLSKIKWIHMIIDEGHRMKNSSSKLSATLTQYYTTRYRLILTGTPLQNNLPELWALLNFVLPTIFKSVKSFDEWFNTPFANTGGQDKMELTEEEQILVIRRLHKVLRPFLLRRLKKDVEKDLPDKTEKVIKCKFSALQARLYKQMVTHNKLVVSDGKGGKTGARGLSNMIMQLRKLCNHPFVFDEVENQMNPLNTSNDLLWRTAGKFELLDRILPKYHRTGHRILMFFQMTAIMDIMEDFLRYRGMQFLRLDGTTKSDDRSELLREFNAPNSPYFMFLLSTRAGGLGLNLQTADTVIIYDSDWNPHQDLQAQDRAHRIGQKNEVRILRLISSNSVEEKILERAKYKLDMDGKVIQAGRFDNKSSETDRDAMLRVMLETADAAETLEQEEMDDEDMNMLLARSEDELVIFRQMDEERAKDPTYGNLPGSKRVPRLMQENELPEIYMSDGNPIADEPVEIQGRGARERTRVKYDDGLTEEQWVMAVEDDEDSPEAAAARKQARKERREQNRLKGIGPPGSMDNSPSGSRETTEEPEPEPTPKKSRSARKPGKGDKRKAEDDDEAPPAKRKRGGPSRPKIAAANGEVSAKNRAVLQASLRSVFDSLMNLESAPESGSDDDDEEDERRLIIGPFVALPPKKDFPDYYMIIKEPISMKMIEKKIKKEEYSSLNDLKRDIQTLCMNAKTYNEDGSLIFVDAVAIENACESRIREELIDHPELGDFDDSSRNGGSTAPTTNAGTPLPAAPSSGKIKLTFNNSQYANGGSSGVQSDDDD
ncbi:putative chromatin structure-remodeling complex subunit snf21 [Venustampulla echinocandica]|uniref:Putative chromatin structure-remodeling complex subunit snf21 n=1 Tax=Venustampulla echinocandica TaxID=2656787 RepID=A0A370TYJ8_9HELO|nr:putative chromatin structure-remodeling complex subunit snf21 [Venustampulla echinocandica]RDL40593.1 putative chromatin structure-remodeling complex subunit snf21 [Venustampulla echinocandica]